MSLAYYKWFKYLFNKADTENLSLATIPLVTIAIVIVVAVVSTTYPNLHIPQQPLTYAANVSAGIIFLYK